MDKRIKIRKGKESDIPQLVKLYSGVKEIEDFVGMKYDKGYFMHFIRPKSNMLFVAECDGEICGALNAEMAEFTFLNNVVVARAWRGKGIGGSLIKRLEQESRRRGNRTLLALVYDWNKPMHKIMRHYDYARGKKTVIYSKKV